MTDHTRVGSMFDRIRWRRKSDGVVVSTLARNNARDVLVTREDTGRTYWATWDGLRRKYERLE